MNRVFDKSVIEKYGIDFELPRHVGIIMDGNGRWAKRRGKPRTFGHRAGMETLHNIVKTASDLGIEVLTVYAFSTENWARPKAEVDALMLLLKEYFTRYIDDLCKAKVRIRHLGDPSGFSPEIQKLIKKTVDATEKNEGITVNLALNYGSRQEIVHAVRELARDAVSGIISPDDIDTEAVSNKLYTSGEPDLDLLIRTSGEQRISNFLLYQAAYAEFVFVDECWPDFTSDVFVRTLFEYAGRDRRYGGIEQDKK